MSNKLIDALNREDNYKLTENGATSYKSTLDKVQDMFGLAGSYRNRSDVDCILLFKEAFEENPNLAMKCLFWVRDITNGAGERRYFRVVFHWLCKNYPDTARKNLWVFKYSDMTRWDDLIYTTNGTQLWYEAIEIVRSQLLDDLQSDYPSLCAKWLPSCNASNTETRRLGRAVAASLGLSQKQYRKILSTLRNRINIVETLMSEGKWDEIDFSKLPSKAGFIYSNAFRNREETKDRYEEFINSKSANVNAATLYPYEVVHKALHTNLNDETARSIVNKYWDNLKDVFGGARCSMLCVCDTSGSMTWSAAGNVEPIDVAIGLSLYCAERLDGPFYGKYISFASKPQLIDCMKGIDFCDRVRHIYDTNLCDNTNLTAVFDLLLNTAKKYNLTNEDIPKTICVISDMEIDAATASWDWNTYKTNPSWTKESTSTEMEKIRKEWAAQGYRLPKLVYWNVNARNNTFLDSGDDVSFVSGASQNIFKAVCSGESGIDMMLSVLNSERYANIEA